MSEAVPNDLQLLEKELLFYKTVLNNTHEAILIIQDNNIVLHNQKLIEFTGYTENEVQDMPAGNLIFPADKELLEEGFRQIRTKKNVAYVFTFRMLDKKNEIRWMESKISSIDFMGQPAAIFYIYDISEFKQAEEAVNVSIDLLNTLIDTIPNPMFYKNTRGEFIGCNNAFVNFIGTPKEDILGKTTYDIVPENVAKGFHNLNMKLINKTGYQVRETKIPHADGSLHDVITYHATFYLSDQSVGGIVGILTDISEQKMVEQQLRFTEFRYKQLVKNLNVGVLVFNPRFNGTRFIFSEINLAAERILHTPKEKVIGKSMTEFFNEEYVQDFYQMLRHVWETGSVTKVIQTRKAAQDKEQVLEHSLYKVPSGDIVSIFDDITEAERTQRILKESEEKYRFLVENSSDIILKLDKELVILFASPSCEDKLGVSQQEIVGKNVLQFVLAIDRDMVHLKLQELLQSGESGTSEHRMVTPLGLKWYAWSLQTVATNAADEKLLVAMGRDVTHRKETEIELLRAKQKAEESDRLKSAFVANMSHEIRTPLNAIIGSSELLVGDNLSGGEVKEHLNYIVSSGKTLLNLINEIIDSAKIEAGQVKISISEFNLHEILNDIYGTFRNQSELNKDVDFVVEIPHEDSEIRITSDPYRLKQVLSNLLSNSFKFTDKGHIRLGYAFEDFEPGRQLLNFFVEDTGIGIPKNKFEHIFQRFGQIEDYTQRNYKGTGLGLSISKHLIELLGGHITLESALGIGTTFNISLPVKVSESHEEKDTEQPKANFEWSDKNILVAEDNNINFMIFKKALAKTNATVLWAKDGEQAVKLFKENKIDIVLMDMQMPKMNGYEATRAIKKINEEVPVIAQTASALYEDRQKVMEAGCDDFVPKPINFDSLFPKMNNFMKC